MVVVFEKFLVFALVLTVPGCGGPSNVKELKVKYDIMVASCPDGHISETIMAALKRTCSRVRLSCNLGVCGVYVSLQDEPAAREELAAHRQWAEFVVPHADRLIIPNSPGRSDADRDDGHGTKAPR